jgi:hypothetical protein
VLHIGFWIVTRQVIFSNHKHFNEEALFEELSMAPIANQISSCCRLPYSVLVDDHKTNLKISISGQSGRNCL